MKRKAAIPGFKSESWRIEVACGIDPAATLRRALEKQQISAGVWSVGVQHDADCPCTTSRLPMDACTCELVQVEGRRVR